MNRSISRLQHQAWYEFISAAILLLLLSGGYASAVAQAAAAAPAAAPAAAAPQIAGPQASAPAAATATGQAPGGASATATGSSASTSAANAAAQRTGGVEGTTVAELPTQFQQLVASSTDHLLPIFGQSLFNGVPSTFAPISDVPVDPSYILGPGDSIAIQTVGQVALQYNFTVDRTGAINVPGLGPVHVAGIPYGQLGEFLTHQFSRLYRGFTLTVNMGSLRAIQVFVVGEARRPGSYSISSLSTLLNAVLASGGPSNDGSLRDIQVKRDGKTIVHFDLYDLLLHGDKTNDIRLVSGDVIFIPFVGPQVAVSGSVNVPAIYELKGSSTTIAEAIQLAGGTTAVASTSYARLERIYEHSMRSVEDVNLATQGAETLRNGDILTIANVIERFRNAVTLRGNVANPGRYTWHQGMRLGDLFPDKAALITRNYWSKRNLLGQFGQDYTPFGQSAQAGQGSLQLNGTTTERQAANPGADTGTGSGTSPNTGSRNAPVTQAGTTVSSALTGTNTNFTAQNDVILSAPDIDWSYAVIERLSTKDLKTSLIPFNLGRLVLDGDPSQNFELEPGDIVTVFSTADIRVPISQQTRFVRLEGEFMAPGVYSVRPGETLRSLLARAGGFTPDAYLYASEFTRESVRRVQTQRLREYADQLEAQISAVTANNTARAISPSDQLAAGASAEDARSAVSRLRQIQPIGRIVLDLHPNSGGLDSVPDLQLEDGDRFIVPRVPSSVTVEGQVYNANAFVFDPGHRMIDYLHKAGGPDRQADKKRSFILRADGSVVSEQYADVKKATVYPGDTIVVPPIIDRRAIFQRVVDLAGVVSNFGFSAATLYLLTRE
ncbi:MAG TPA: SLBB domain-containing protein [Acidobacteriaceae bacterium]|nr:SLBB domain-containing protein [Acidobacteriaceae bacterium]